MFDTINGLPLHVLVVHIVVVLAPLAALFGVAFGAVRRWRWLLRWPLVVTTLLTVASAFVAVESGNALRGRLGLEHETIHPHGEAGQLLFNVAAVFGVVVLAAAFSLGGPSGLRSGKGERTGLAPMLQTIVAVVLVLGAVGLGYQVFQAGESGARTVWGPIISNTTAP
jgi:hypothetical protein